MCYEEQNFNILQIQIQGLSRTFKYFQAPFLFSSTFKGLEFFFPKFKHFQGFLKHAMNPGYSSGW